jgi:hypothetical protein
VNTVQSPSLESGTNDENNEYEFTWDGSLYDNYNPYLEMDMQYSTNGTDWTDAGTTYANSGWGAVTGADTNGLYVRISVVGSGTAVWSSRHIGA